MDLHALTANDLKIVREVVRLVREQFGNTLGRPNYAGLENDQQAPETYVARVSANGIPGLDIGAGTADAGDDVPGEAECDIYRVDGQGTGELSLIPVGFGVTVYNLSTSSVSPSSWCLVTRDKFGDWFAVVGGGGGSAEAENVVDFMICRNSAAGGDGTFDGEKTDHNTDGTLVGNGVQVWLRDANILMTLIQDGTYLCRKTSDAYNGREVWTLEDSKLSVLNDTATQIVLAVLYLVFQPARTWNILQAADRIAYVKRILEMQETGGTLHEDVYKLIFDPGNAWVVTESAGAVTTQRSLNLYDGASLITSNTWEIYFLPDYTWDITGSNGQASVTRILNAYTFGTLTDDHIWGLDFYPSANHWDLTVLADGRVSIDRFLSVREAGQSFTGQSIWDIVFTPASDWVVTNDGVGGVTIQYVGTAAGLSVYEAGSLVASGVTALDFYPSQFHWTIIQTAPGYVTIDRNFYVRREGESFVGQSIFEMVFVPGSPNLAWEVETDGVGSVTIRRNLDISDGLFTYTEDTWRINFEPAAAWDISEGADGDAYVTRVLDVYEGGSLQASGVWKITFDATDFQVTGTGAGGTATVQTRGFTGTVGPFYRYQCIGTDADLDEMVWSGFPVVRGLVKDHTVSYV